MKQGGSAAAGSGERRAKPDRAAPTEVTAYYEPRQEVSAELALATVRRLVT